MELAYYLKRSPTGVQARSKVVLIADGMPRSIARFRDQPTGETLFKQILSYGLLLSALIAGCAENNVGPGNIARPLVGNYDLESRTVNFTTQTDSGTVVEQSVLVPPQVRGLLHLSGNGRYGQVDTTAVSDSTVVRIQNGRWSVLDSFFYFITDDNRQFEDRFTFDGLRLVRTSMEIRHSSGRLFNVEDVWLKQGPDETPPDP